MHTKTQKPHTTPHRLHYHCRTHCSIKQRKKCKNIYPTPLPTKLFTFPAYSDTRDPDTTCDELPVSNTSSEAESDPKYKLLPEDINTDTDFTPFQEHTLCITGPSSQSIREQNRGTLHI